MREFWTDAFTDKSLEVLHKIKKEFKFILIGGWAVYLFTKSQKSKDIDIVIDFDSLNYLKSKYNLSKNVNLRKYEFEVEGISIDVFVQYFSKLAIPCEDLRKYTTEIEGFTVPWLEAMLILKQQAEFNRKGIKAQKDRIDILLLLLLDIGIQRYLKLIKKYKLGSYFNRLRKIVSESKEEWAYLGYTNPREIKKLKVSLLKKLASKNSKKPK